MSEQLPSKTGVSPLTERLRHVARFLERPGCEAHEIVYAVTLDEGIAEIERLRAAISRWSQHDWGLRCKCDACEGLRDLVRPAHETSASLRDPL